MRDVINVDEAYNAAGRLRGHVVVSYEPGSSNYDMTLVLDFLAVVHSDIKKLEAEIERLRTALLLIANAADDVAVKFFDTNTMEPIVEYMREVTVDARALLKGEEK